MVLRFGEGDCRQRLAFDLQHGQIGFRIGADNFRIQRYAIGKRNLNLVSGFDYMMIGQDEAIFADDDPGAQVGHALRSIVGRETIAKETAEYGIVHQGIALGANLFAGGNIDNRGLRFFCRVGVGRDGTRRSAIRHFPNGDRISIERQQSRRHPIQRKQRSRNHCKGSYSLGKEEPDLVHGHRKRA